jgi:hypothetical protein
VNESARVLGILFFAAAVGMICHQIGMGDWQMIITAFLAAVGLALIVVGRYRW